jgi:hypothetical protein
MNGLMKGRQTKETTLHSLSPISHVPAADIPSLVDARERILSLGLVVTWCGCLLQEQPF